MSEREAQVEEEPTSNIKDQEIDSSWDTATGELFHRWSVLLRARRGQLEPFLEQVRTRVGDDVADAFDEYMNED